MNDKDFLIWLHQRLTEVYGEVEHVDYMHKLRAIINATDSSVVTPNLGTDNDLTSILMEQKDRNSQ